MPEWKVWLWAVGCIGDLLLITPIAILGPAGFWADGQHEGSYAPALVLASVGFALYVVALMSSFVHTARRKDLEPRSRRRWLWGLFVLNGYLLPVFWFRLIRPLAAEPG